MVLTGGGAAGAAFSVLRRSLLLATLALALWQQALLWPGLLLLAGLTLVAAAHALCASRSADAAV